MRPCPGSEASAGGQDPLPCPALPAGGQPQRPSQQPVCSSEPPLLTLREIQKQGKSYYRSKPTCREIQKRGFRDLRTSKTPESSSELLISVN